MKKYNFDESTFIQGFYIPEAVCDNVIKFFNDHPDQKYPSQVGQNSKVNEEVKKGTEMFCPVPVIAFHLPDYLKCLHQCCDDYLLGFKDAKNGRPFSIENNIKIQHYQPGEGYYKWHWENTGHDENIKRHLVFMTYLNTVKNGGTELNLHLKILLNLLYLYYEHPCMLQLLH